MQKFLCGLGLAAMLVTAGCGGGGGGSAVSGSGTLLSQDVVGTWNVPNLGLPNNQLGVQSNGDVVVNSEGTVRGTRNRSLAAVKIGTCNPDGSITLNGNWIAQDTHYRITGSGQVSASSHSISLQATVETVNGSNVTVVLERTESGGVKMGDTEYPPPPPSWEEDSSDGSVGTDDSFYSVPPPPPY